MRIAVSASWLAFAAFALVPAVAWAEDTPAEAAKKVRAAFPEPSEKAAFSSELDLMMDGKKEGEGSVSVTADSGSDGKVWRGKGSFLLGTADAPQQKISSASTLEGNLRLNHEERNETRGTTKLTTMLIRNEKGFEVNFTEGEKETVKTVLEAPADTTTDEPVGLLLFLRQCPAEAAKYELTTADSDDRKLKKLQIEVKGAGRMKDAKLPVDLEAWVVTVNDGSKVTQLYFDPKDRTLLGLSFGEGSPWLVKKGLVKEKATRDSGPVPDFKKDAKSAKELGVRFAMGLLVGDIDVIDSSFSWSTWAASTGGIDEETLKTMVLEGIKANLKEQLKPDQAWGVVKGASENAEEKAQEDGSVKVKLGAPFHKISFTAKEIDGKWLITAMDQPK